MFSHHLIGHFHISVSSRQSRVYTHLGAHQPGRKVLARYMFLCSPHRRQSMTSQIDFYIDCRHYGDREL